MDSRPNLLVVDDEVMNQNIILDLLEDEFEVDFVCDGQECLNVVKNKVPDLILLDVNMPILNGLDTCKHLRKESKFNNLPIIFISALASPQERLNGYDAGGDDYLTKPFEEDELKAKINLLLKVKYEKTKNKEEIRSVTNKAIAAITNSTELSAVFHFMKSLLSTNNLDAVLDLVKKTLHSFGLEGCVMLTHTSKPVYFCTDKKTKPIEQDVLREMHLSGKVIEFSNRAIFNTAHAAILIRKMPDDDNLKKRYIEHLCIIIDALEEKIIQRVNDFKQQKHYQLLENTIKIVALRLKEVKEQSAHNRAKNREILEKLSEEVALSFHKSSLDESDKAQVKQLISIAENKLDKLYEDGQQSGNVFDEIIKELCHLLQKPTLK